MSDELEVRMEKYRALAKKAAGFRAEREYLEEFKKSKLAILMKEAEQAGHSTAAAQEREARASKDYADYLLGLRVAVEQCEEYEYYMRLAFQKEQSLRNEDIVEMSERKAYRA